MRHKLVNFTRGSQLIGHFGFMFAAGLKGPALMATAVFAGLIGSIFASSIDFFVSINVAAIVIVGGMGSIPGVVAGSIAQSTPAILSKP